jgi:hypothetical protein
MDEEMRALTSDELDEASGAMPKIIKKIITALILDNLDEIMKPIDFSQIFDD